MVPQLLSRSLVGVPIVIRDCWKRVIVACKLVSVGIIKGRRSIRLGYGLVSSILQQVKAVAIAIDLRCRNQSLGNRLGRAWPARAMLDNATS